MKEQLLSTPTPQDDYFLARYNRVVKAYNELSEPEDPQLLGLRDTFLVHRMDCLINTMTGNILLLLIHLLPLLNITLLSLLAVYFLKTWEYNLIHRKNKVNIGNPFKQYVYFPEAYAQLGKHFARLDLTSSERKDFSFNLENRAVLPDTGKHDSSLKTEFSDGVVTVYDEYLHDSYFLLPRVLYRGGIMLIVATFITGLSLLICAIMLDWFQ